MPMTSNPTHVYASYIEKTAEECYSKQLHEPLCKTKQPYDYSGQTDSNGFVYDCYIIQHCDCWLADNFHNLTLARKFEALRALARTYNLHSASCDLYKRTSIMYRNRPEVMTGWCSCWLSVDMQPGYERACPACQKPIFYAPNAPEDTAKQACSDPKCVNAHGIVQWFPVDTHEEPAYTEPEPTDPKGPMSTELFTAAFVHAEVFKARRDTIKSLLLDTLQDFIDFQISRGKTHEPDQKQADAYFFTEHDDKFFYFDAEEVYLWGEYVKPSIDLPFEFVKDPEAYKARVLREEAELKERITAQNLKYKQDQVARLKQELLEAETSLAKAEQQGDPIKTVANRYRAQELRKQFMTEDMGK